MSPTKKCICSNWHHLQVNWNSPTDSIGSLRGAVLPVTTVELIASDLARLFGDMGWENPSTWSHTKKSNTLTASCAEWELFHELIWQIGIGVINEVNLTKRKNRTPQRKQPCHWCLVCRQVEGCSFPMDNPGKICGALNGKTVIFHTSIIIYVCPKWPSLQVNRNVDSIGAFNFLWYIRLITDSQLTPPPPPTTHPRVIVF